MKLSAKVIYGARFMVDLALHHGHGSTLLKDIAVRQDVSEKYLWQLSAVLKRAGLVRAERGAKGGFVLSRLPGEINLKEIFIALEGDIELGHSDRKSRSGLSAEPVLAEFWKKLATCFTSTLEAVTLEELVDRYRSGEGFINYEI
ncbi:MAG: Rrf2 family transcriptional regulator [Candidatus Omnitrophica bacterium]|nr:Rrf2 family transcriptional regulator [Candidatus Omnitrophota bacterium]